MDAIFCPLVHNDAETTGATARQCADELVTEVSVGTDKSSAPTMIEERDAQIKVMQTLKALVHWKKRGGA